jgi:hypothetical protein
MGQHISNKQTIWPLSERGEKSIPALKTEHFMGHGRLDSMLGSHIQFQGWIFPIRARPKPPPLSPYL